MNKRLRVAWLLGSNQLSTDDFEGITHIWEAEILIIYLYLLFLSALKNPITVHIIRYHTQVITKVQETSHDVCMLEIFIVNLHD